MCDHPLTVLVIAGDPVVRKLPCDLSAFLDVEVVAATDGGGPPATTLAPGLAP
jgi:hypothetical protein